jgi:hypothetical protein
MLQHINKVANVILTALYFAEDSCSLRLSYGRQSKCVLIGTERMA